MAASLKEFRESVGDERPIISKVTLQVKRKDRVSVFVDDQFAFGISEDVARRNGLAVGFVLDPPTLVRLELDEAARTCKRVAISYISYRMRSEAELRSRLSKEEAPPEIIDSVLDELRKVGLVDDGAFAKAYSRDAMAARKLGPHRIARSLRKSGIHDQHLHEALIEVRTMLQEEDLVLSVARKRWAQLSNVDDIRKRKKRLYDFLVRRGFDFDDVRRVLEEVAV